MSLKPFTPAELAAWVSETVGLDEHPDGYELKPGEFTITTLAASFDPPILYDKAREIIRRLRHHKVIGEKHVRIDGKRSTVFWRLEQEPAAPEEEGEP